MMANGTGKRGRNRGGGTGSYEIGFGRPPQHTRFQKGRSGNPGGRPKGEKAASAPQLYEIVQKVLGQKLTVTVNRRKIKMPALQFALSKILRKAAEDGDVRCMKVLIDLSERFPPTAEKMVRVDNSAIDELKRRLNLIADRGAKYNAMFGDDSNISSSDTQAQPASLSEHEEDELP